MTLLDAFNHWLSASGNEDQPQTAISGRKTAINLAAAALGGSPADIELSKLSSFDDTALTDLLRLGASQLRRNPPSEKTLANYRSYLRGVLANSVDDRKPYASLSANREAIFSHRPPMGGFKDLPDGIRQTISAIIEWKSPGTLPLHEERHRTGTWGSTSARNNRSVLTRYAHRLMDIQSVDDLTLVDLVSRDAFTAWRQSDEKFLRDSAPKKGRRHLQGFSSAVQLAIALGVIAGQFLRAKEPHWLEQEAESAGGEQLHEFFYRKAKQLKEEHARQVGSRTKVDVSHLTPQDFWDVGLREFHAPPARGNTARAQTLARKRTALVYLMGSVTPLRARNFREMRWGHNLHRHPNGLWETRFQGEELKIAVRKGGVNSYRHTYGPHLSRLIDEYLKWLKTTYGPDIQRRVPYVFTKDPEAGRDLATPLSPAAFNSAFTGLWLNVRGERITPHRMRDVVATYLIRWGIANGKDGIALAAHALGDTIETVISNYYRPNTAAFAAYEASLSAHNRTPDAAHQPPETG